MPNIDKLKIVNNMTINDMRSILVFMILVFCQQSIVNGQQFFKLFLFLILYFHYSHPPQKIIMHYELCIMHYFWAFRLRFSSAVGLSALSLLASSSPRSKISSKFPNPIPRPQIPSTRKGCRSNP